VGGLGGTLRRTTSTGSWLAGEGCGEGREACAAAVAGVLLLPQPLCCPAQATKVHVDKAACTHIPTHQHPRTRSRPRPHPHPLLIQRCRPAGTSYIDRGPHHHHPQQPHRHGCPTKSRWVPALGMLGHAGWRVGAWTAALDCSHLPQVPLLACLKLKPPHLRHLPSCCPPATPCRPALTLPHRRPPDPYTLSMHLLSPALHPPCPPSPSICPPFRSLSIPCQPLPLPHSHLSPSHSAVRQEPVGCLLPLL